jgi:hypothetical protein
MRGAKPHPFTWGREVCDGGHTGSVDFRADGAGIRRHHSSEEHRGCGAYQPLAPQVAVAADLEGSGPPCAG